jgi:amino acid adenylation domain-containing protein
MTVGALAHQAWPYEQVVAAVSPDRSVPLVRAMFNLQPPMEQAEELYLDTAMFDLTLGFEERAEGWHGWLEYDGELFDAATAARLAAHYRTLLASALERPDAPIGRLPLMTEAERRELLVEWNQTAAAPPERRVHEQVAAQASRTPDAPAVMHQGRQWSYRELLEQASAWAARLDSPGQPIAIALSPSLPAAAALLGVLQSGAACMPLDTSQPRERLSELMARSGARVLISETRLRDALPAENLQVLCIDAPPHPRATPRGHDPAPPARGTPASLDVAPQARPNPPSLGGSSQARETPAVLDGSPLDGLAYVLHTSGSTGRPKAVCMPHRGLANLIGWQGGAALRTLQLAPWWFDVSFQELFSTWCSGGLLVLADPELRQDPSLLGALIAEQRIERLFVPPVVLQQLAERFWDDAGQLSSLRQVIAAGEQLRLTRELIKLFAALPDCTLENQYGPTETHVVTAHRLGGPPSGWPLHPPIGKPIAGTRIYILDAAGQPQPIGVPGELHVAGAGLARDYLGDAALTRERFVPDPWGAPGERMYRTGDRARWRNSGELEFIGRIDDQLKVRGFRIEPGEIEARLAEHAAVQTSVVVALGEPPDRLCAYVVPSGVAPAGRDLAAHLAARLPRYMVPGAWVFLEALPLLPNGKLDRGALPAPSEGGTSNGYLAPRTDAERRIAEIWAELLSLERVGVDDDFFDLGGHSLVATQIALRVSRAFDVAVPTRHVFECATVAGLAARVEELRR